MADPCVHPLTKDSSLPSVDRGFDRLADGLKEGESDERKRNGKEAGGVWKVSREVAGDFGPDVFACPLVYALCEDVYVGVLSPGTAWLAFRGKEVTYEIHIEVEVSFPSKKLEGGSIFCL